MLRHHHDADAGYLDRPAVAAFAAAAGAPDGDVYICGPEPFMALVEATLLDLGVDPARVLIERFDPAAAPVSSDGDGSDGAAGPYADVTETVTVVLGGTTTTVAYRPGDTLLETGRRAGLQPPFSCQAGDCATCMALVREGAAAMRATTALTPDEVDEGWVLTCQALPRGRAVTVEHEAL